MQIRITTWRWRGNGNPAQMNRKQEMGSLDNGTEGEVRPEKVRSRNKPLDLKNQPKRIVRRTQVAGGRIGGCEGKGGCGIDIADGLRYFEYPTEPILTFGGKYAQ